MSFKHMVSCQYNIATSLTSFYSSLKKEFKTTNWRDFAEHLAYHESDGDAPLEESEELSQSEYKQNFDRFMRDLKANLKTKRDHLILYRAVNVPKLTKLNKEEIGVAWSYKKSGAIAYHGNEGRTYILTALVPFDAVIIDATIGHNICFEGTEHEIRIRSGVDITIVEITDDKNKIKPINLKAMS